MSTTNCGARWKGAVAGTLSRLRTLVSRTASLFAGTFDCTGFFVLADGTIIFAGPPVRSSELT